MEKPNPDQAEKTIIKDSLLNPDVGFEESSMPFKPSCFTAPSKLMRSANSPFQVWKNPNHKKSRGLHVDQGNNNQQLEHQLGIPNTCYAQATNNKTNILWKPNPYKAEKTTINDSLLTLDAGVEKSIMPFTFMDPSKIVRSSSSSFQVWKKSRDDQGHNNQRLKFQLSIPNTYYAQATNNKINIMWKPIPVQAKKAVINDSLLTPDSGVDKSIMPSNLFSFMAPTKLVRSENSSFHVWKKPNEKKNHDDQGRNNNQQLEHQLVIHNICYAQTTNNKINIIWKPIPVQAEKIVINDSLLTPNSTVDKSIMPFKRFPFMAPSKLVRSENSSFQVWKNPNEKKSHDDQRNNNQQLEHQLGIPNICYAQTTNNKINIIWKPIPVQAEKTIINDNLLTPNVGVEESIMPFNLVSFMAPSKLVRSESSSYQVWKNPNDKKSHYYDVDQGNNSQQSEHHLGIPNTCYAQATNNKTNILEKPNPYKAEKTIIIDSLLTHDVGVEKSIMPIKPFSSVAPSKLVRSSSSSFQVWKKPNEKKIHGDYVDQGNNNQQLEHQFGIPNIYYAQTTNNKNKIAEKPKVLKRLANGPYLVKNEDITDLEKTTKKLRRNIHKIRYTIKHNFMMKRQLLIENHQLKSQIYILEMNKLHKEDEIAKNMEEVQKLKWWLESNKQGENGVGTSNSEHEDLNKLMQ